MCTHGCGGYLHGDICAVRKNKNRCLKKIALMNHMCQKYAANIAQTELTYKRPINTEDGESYLKEEEEMNNQPKHSLHLNIRSKSPSFERKKQCTSYVGGKKLFITVNK